MQTSERRASQTLEGPHVDDKCVHLRRVHPAGRQAVWVAAVVLLTVLGAVVRLLIAGDSILADELSTYWIVSTNGLGGVLSVVHTDAEITPPLYFIAAWLSTRIELTPELLRAPSVIAGVATIPVIYALGVRTIGRSAALVAAAITTLSPFMVFYSAEGRGYALMMLLVALSTLSLLLAIDTRRTSFWALYAACSALAMYTHYTCAFALAAQFAWVVWAHPDLRRPALLANVAAAAAFLPWISGVRNDFRSPTTEILSALSPFDWGSVWDSLSQVAVGYPYDIVSLEELPGWPGLVLLMAGVILAILGLLWRLFRAGSAGRPTIDTRVVLVAGLALSVPVGEAIVSAIGTDIFGGRNLAAAWPAFGLSLAALLMAPGQRLRVAAVALAVAGFAVGTVKMLDERYKRPDFDAAAQFIDGRAAAGDVVIDSAVLSPGPLSPMDVALTKPHPLVRFAAPAQREQPFGVFDQVFSEREVMRSVATTAGGRPIYVIAVPSLNRPGPPPQLFPDGYRLAETRIFPGTARLRLQVWSRP